MGTRSLTHIKQAGDTLVTIYRQYDGYPTGMGADIANLLGGGVLVNGLGLAEDDRPRFNGMGCAAAQLIAGLKDGAGNVYIYEPDSVDCGEEYVYTIDGDTFNTGAGINLKVQCVYGDGPTLYDGPIGDFDPAAAEAKLDAILEAI